MQAGLLGHEEQPPELTLRNLHRERCKRGKRWSQVLQLSNVSFETGGLNVGGMIDQRNPPHPLIKTCFANFLEICSITFALFSRMGGDGASGETLKAPCPTKISS
jgi:hypothetical protein